MSKIDNQPCLSAVGLLEGLMYEGKFAFQNRLGLYWEGKMHLKIHWVSLYIYYSWKKIYVSNLQHVFTKTCLEEKDLSKIQLCKYFV